MRRALLLTTFALAAPGCPVHDAFCAEDLVVHCTESCGTPDFRQCGACPAGSFDATSCPSAGCDPMHARPSGDCDDASCAAGLNGRCFAAEGGDTCVYDACTTDAECAPGEHCACDSGPLGAHVCVPATCGAPDDCAALPCQPVVGCGGLDGRTIEVRALRCKTPDDACASDLDCAVGEHCTLALDAPAGQPWTCLPEACP